MSAGFYRPLGDSFLQACTAAAALPEPDEVHDGWMPSSRSIAFRRDAFEAAGGYPEWLEVGEDMYFDHRMLATGARIGLATDAVVYWRVRPTLAATWQQYARYAGGDARAGMYPERHFVRFAAYGFAGIALATKNRWLLGLLAIAGAVYASAPVRRARRRLRDRPAERAASIAGVPATMAFIDVAKMWGYGSGLARRVADEIFYD
jgi:hypothetical protein